MKREQGGVAQMCGKECVELVPADWDGQFANGTEVRVDGEGCGEH